MFSAWHENASGPSPLIGTAVRLNVALPALGLTTITVYYKNGY